MSQHQDAAQSVGMPDIEAATEAMVTFIWNEDPKHSGRPVPANVMKEMMPIYRPLAQAALAAQPPAATVEAFRSDCKRLLATVTINEPQSARKTSRYVEPTQGFIPPPDCRHPNSCHDHNECMYVGCSAVSRPLRCPNGLEHGACLHPECVSSCPGRLTLGMSSHHSRTGV
jgi:hypothetical protein